jgi:hypothetical protein
LICRRDFYRISARIDHQIYYSGSVYILFLQAESVIGPGSLWIHPSFGRWDIRWMPIQSISVREIFVLTNSRSEAVEFWAGGWWKLENQLSGGWEGAYITSQHAEPEEVSDDCGGATIGAAASGGCGGATTREAERRSSRDIYSSRDLQ